MKYTWIAFFFIFSTNICLGQVVTDSTIVGEKYISVYVTKEKKIMLYGEKASFRKLEKYLQLTHKRQAKIGTLRPTLLDVFAVFERVVKLLGKYDVDSEWFSDPEFSTPFFE